jgi:hypothetical protein
LQARIAPAFSPQGDTMSISFPFRVPTGVWSDEFTYQHDADSRTYRTRTVSKKYGINGVSLFRWGKKRCRFLGRPIKTLLVKPAVNHLHSGKTKVRVYLQDDLETIQKRQPLDPETSYRVDERGTWVVEKQLGEQLGLGDPHRFASYWKKKRSKLHDGAALRHEETCNTAKHQGSPTDTTIYLLEDGRAILEGKESRGKGHMWRNGSLLSKTDRDAEAKRIVRDLLKDGPLRSWDLRNLAKEKGVTYDTLYRIKKSLKIKSRWGGRGVAYWCLPGQKPPKNGAGSVTPRRGSRDPNGPSQPMPSAAHKAPAKGAEAKSNQLQPFHEKDIHRTHDDQSHQTAKEHLDIAKRQLDALNQIASKIQPQRKRKTKSPNDDRDEYCYEQIKAQKKSLAAIRTEVNGNKDWDAIYTDQGISEAAKRYAKRKGLPWPV